MRLAGRIAAAIEVLEEIFSHHVPAASALHEWGRAHRFAGSGDRSAIGNLVYDSLRQKNFLSHCMGNEKPRSLVLGCVGFLWQHNLDELASAMEEKFSHGPLSDEERSQLASPPDEQMPDWIAGNYPQWLDRQFKQVFGKDAALQANALAARAPVDMRVNTLKTSREELLKEFEKHGAVAGPLSDLSVRIAPSLAGARSPNIEIETAHGKGWFEVQDTASQIVSALAGAQPGETVLDLCAGAGGKTLALAAHMQNQGKIFAYDKDKRRLRPIFERLARAGVQNVDVIGADETAKLDELNGAMDMVFVDAPCSGSGSWRRKPDAKWRLTQDTLNQRIKDQKQVLKTGAAKVKPGGRLVYVTCSVLACENTGQVNAFLAENKDFSLRPIEEIWRDNLGEKNARSADGKTGTLLLTPHSHNVDGFFVAVFQRRV